MHILLIKNKLKYTIKKKIKTHNLSVSFSSIYNQLNKFKRVTSIGALYDYLISRLFSIMVLILLFISYIPIYI